MLSKSPGWGKFTQLVANHIFGNKDWDKNLAIMDIKSMSHKVRGYSGFSGPCLNRLSYPTTV